MTIKELEAAVPQMPTGDLIARYMSVRLNQHELERGGTDVNYDAYQQCLRTCAVYKAELNRRIGTTP